MHQKMLSVHEHQQLTKTTEKSNYNQFSEVVFHAFENANLEKKIDQYLIALENFAKNPPLKLEIKSSSPLLLIALPMLKRISSQMSIELTAVRGQRPAEIIRVAKVLRAHKLNVNVKYLKSV